MSVIMVEGFDDGLLTKKWTSVAGVVGTGGGHYQINSTYGRNGTLGIQMQQDSGFNCALSKAIPAAFQHATIIAGAAFKWAGADGSSFACGWLFGSDGGATTQVEINMTAAGFVRAFRGDGGALLGTASSAIPQNTWGYLEVKVHLHPTAGTVDVHWNGNSIMSLSGVNTRNAGTATVFDLFRISPLDRNGNIQGYDDVYLLNGAGASKNDFLGDCLIETRKPSGNGTHSDFVNDAGNSTNNYSHVNETTPDTTTYVQSATLGAKDSYTIAPQTTTGSPVCVQVGHYAEKDDAGSRALAPLMVIGGTDYVGATESGLSQGAYTDQLTVIETNPATSADWTNADINAAEWGMTVAV